MLGGASWAAMAMTHIRNLPQRDVGTAAGLKAATHRMSFKASASILQNRHRAAEQHGLVHRCWCWELLSEESLHTSVV